MTNVEKTSEYVAVVRCKDCKYYAIDYLTKAMQPDRRYKPSVCINGRYGVRRKPDWFCADGERRAADAERRENK